MTSSFDHAQAVYDAAEPEWDEGENDVLTAHQVAERLAELLDTVTYMDDDERRQSGLDGLVPTTQPVTSYADGGVLTRDAGFTLTLDNGSEYQITIVRSR